MSASALAAGAGVVAAAIVADRTVSAVGRGSDYVENGAPTEPVAALGLAIVRGACRRYAESPSSVPDTRVAAYENTCRPYLDSIGTTRPPSLVKPYDGLQCDGARYQGFFLLRTRNGDGTLNPEQGSNAFRTRGPITGARIDSNGRIRATTRGTIEAINAAYPPLSASAERQISSTQYGAQAVITGFVTQAAPDGDNCGNPHPVFTPQFPSPPTIPNPEPVSPGPNLDVDLNVIIVAPGAIQFNIGLGPIIIDPFGGGGGGGGGGGDAPPGDVGSPGSPGDTGDGGDADGEAPLGEVLTGLKIGFITPPVGGNEYAPGIYRGVCYIYMGTSDGVDHDPAGAMLRDGQFIFAEKDNLTHWFVSANRGYNLRVTPYYRPVEVEEE